MRTYEEIVLNAAEIAIEENGGRINCFEIEDFKAFTKTLEGAGYSWEMDASTDWIIIEEATEPRRMKMRTEAREISERVASLPLERQIRIASSYPRFGTIANAARVVDTQPKRKVLN